MGETNLENLKKVDEYDSPVDSGRRITLRKRKNVKSFDHYHTTAYEDGTLLLRPRVLVDPKLVIDSSTLKMIEESLKNVEQGNLGDTFNPEDFEGLLSEKD